MVPDLSTWARRSSTIPVGAGVLLRGWASAVTHPSVVMRELPDSGAPKAGFAAVLTRFAVQDLTQTLPLALLDRPPFMPARLPLRPENHYRAQLVFLPPFGLGQWLLMSGAAYGLLRLVHSPSDVRRVMDVIGVGMLIPMPPLWLGDAALIATDRFRMPALAFVNVPVQLWETVLFTIGLHQRLRVPWPQATSAALAATTVYILGASSIVR